MENTNVPVKQLFTINEFATRYNISRSKTYSLLNSGDLRGVKVGRKVMIKQSDADEFIDNLPEWGGAA